MDQAFFQVREIAGFNCFAGNKIGFFFKKISHSWASANGVVQLSGITKGNVEDIIGATSIHPGVFNQTL
jgi:hypothetical protein